MEKKHVLTNAEIEKDIINSLKHPPKMSKSSYKKLTLPIIIIAAVLLIIEIFYPIFIIWILLASIVFFVGYAILNHLRLKNQIKNVSIHDYHITQEVVQSTSKEQYKAERGGKIRHTEWINNYTVCFENGKNWRVPKESYIWSERLRMTASQIYANTHRQDACIVVTNKKTNEIIMAYHTDLFEYKN